MGTETKYYCDECKRDCGCDYNFTDWDSLGEDVGFCSNRCMYIYFKKKMTEDLTYINVVLEEIADGKNNIENAILEVAYVLEKLKEENDDT